MMKWGYILFLVLSIQQMIGQSGTITSRPTDQGLELKWYSQQLINYEGVDVWRKESGQEWEKINSSLVVPTSVSTADNDEVAFVNELVQKKQQPKGVLLLNSMLSSFKHLESAKALGIYFLDEKAENGKSYRYKITGSNGNEIALSERKKKEELYEVKQPDEFTVKSTKRKVRFFWTLSPLEYYGVNIYASINGVEQRMTELPILSGNNSSDTSLQFQYEMELEENTVYEFFIRSVGFFNDESQPSERIAVNIGDFTPPLQPQGVSYKQKGKNEVHLSWSVYDDVSADRLSVFRGKNLEKLDEEVEIPSLDVVTYTDSPGHGDWYYAIGAVDKSGNKTLSNPVLVHVEDMEPPSIPVGLVASADTGWVHLSWNAVSNEDLKGYQVYRSGGAQKDFKLLNADVTSKTSYSFQTSKRTKSKMQFYVTSMDSSLNRSEPSMVVEVEQKDIIAPQIPVIKNAITTDTSIVLKWLANSETDLQEYQIYRKTIADTSYQLVNTVSNDQTSFIDDDIESGKRYQYVVEAHDEAMNNSGYSNTFTVDAPLLKKAEKELKVKWKYKQKKGAMKVSLESIEDFKGSTVLAMNENGVWQPLNGLMTDSKYTINNLSNYKKIKIKGYDNKGNTYISKELSLTTK